MIGQAQKDYSMLSDAQLKQAMMFAQRSNNTPEFLGLMAEANKRKQMRQEASGMQAGQQLAQGPQTQADAVMSGIANLATPSDEQGYASGGIVAFAGGGTSGEDYNSDAYQARLAAEEEAQRAALLPQLSLPFNYRPGSENYPSWLKVLGGTPEWFRKGAGRGNQGGPTAEQANSAGARRAPPSAGEEASYSNEGRRSGPVAAVDKTPPRVYPVGGSTSAKVASAVSAAAPATAAPEATPDWMKAPDAKTLKQIMADNEEAAAKGEAGIKALMDPYAAKIAERRKAIEGETASTAGLLGLKADWFGDDKRKALRDFGFALMAGKDPNAMVNIGAAGKAAADAYEAAKEKRQTRMDALDERDQKLAMARYEMSRGNREEAARLTKEARDLDQTAFANRFNIGKFGEERKEKAKEFDLRERELAQRRELGLAQIRASQAAAGRNQQLELYTALGGGDPKKGYEFAQNARGEPAADLALWKTYASDPMKLEMLKTTNPQLYAMVMAKIASQGGGGFVDVPAKGATVLPR